MRERVAAALEWRTARALGVPRSTSRSRIGEALSEQKEGVMAGGAAGVVVETVLYPIDTINCTEELPEDQASVSVSGTLFQCTLAGVHLIALAVWNAYLVYTGIPVWICIPGFPSSSPCHPSVIFCLLLQFGIPVWHFSGVYNQHSLAFQANLIAKQFQFGIDMCGRLFLGSCNYLLVRSSRRPGVGGKGGCWAKKLPAALGEEAGRSRAACRPGAR